MSHLISSLRGKILKQSSGFGLACFNFSQAAVSENIALETYYHIIFCTYGMNQR